MRASTAGHSLTKVCGFGNTRRPRHPDASMTAKMGSSSPADNSAASAPIKEPKLNIRVVLSEAAVPEFSMNRLM